MRLTLLHEIPEDGDLRRQWNELVRRVEQPQVFYTYEWALAVQRAYGATLRPLVFVQHDEHGALCGVAALAATPDGRGASFLCGTTGDYCDFVSSTTHRDQFVRAILAELRRQDIQEVIFANLPADSATAPLIGKMAAKQGYHGFSRTGYLCAQVSLGALGRHEGSNPVLPRKKMLRRFLNTMGRETPVRLDHARSREAIAAILPDFMQAHIARFLVTGRISNMARHERRVFLSELTSLLSESQWVVLTRMMAGTKVFAWNYGFDFEGTWFWYQPTFDSDLEKYSPGFCLLAKLIEEGADNPQLKTVDLGLGAEEYKDRFANQTREILYVTLHTSALKSYREKLRYFAAQAVRTVPGAESAVRKVLGRCKRLKQHIHNAGFVPAIAWLLRRLGQLIWLKNEIEFYRWYERAPASSNALRLQRLDLNAMAAAASQYDDSETLGYLLRGAARVRQGKAEGFALMDAAGKVLHFAWATDFAGFAVSDLNTKLSAPTADSVMIFDSWTPTAVRGNAYYAHAVEQIAKLLHSRGKQPWIFPAAGDSHAAQELKETGFQRRYSLIRRRFLGVQWIDGDTPSPLDREPLEIHAGPADSAA